MGKSSRSRHHAGQEVYDLLKGLDNLLGMTGSTPKATADRLTKANELARKAMQFAASGINIKEPVKRFIIELEARKDIPPKMLYSVFFLVAPWDQSVATMIAGLLANRCSDHDASIRRASLQQLTSLRIPTLVDVMLAPVEEALKDSSPAVRAAAVLAVLKVATLAASEVDLQHLWSNVDDMMRNDASPEVVHACVAVKLQKEDELTLVKDQKLVEDLMLRLQEFEPHQQASVLALVKLFLPSEEKTTLLGHAEPGVPQVAAFMDVVEPCLHSVNSSTVLAAMDALLCWAKATKNEYWYSQALNRVKKPLYALSRSVDPEVSLVALCHISILVQHTPYGFAEDYMQFFCHYGDPAYIKQKKISVLKYLATEENQLVLVNELMEYTKNRDVATSREAVRALAHIVLSVESVGLIESLMDLLACGDSTVVSETVLVLKDIIRRFPDVVVPYAATLQSIPVSDLQTAEATAAYFWIRAELMTQGVAEPEGQEPAPYVFEEFAEQWSTMAMVSRLELMFATVRVALVDAPMTLPVLRRILYKALQDPELLVSEAAKLIIFSNSGSVQASEALFTGLTGRDLVADSTPDAQLDELISEFNSLAVVYERPSRTFVDRSAAHMLREVAKDGGVEEAEELGAALAAASQEAQLLDFGPEDGQVGGADTDVADVMDGLAGTGMESAASTAMGIADARDGAAGLDAMGGLLGDLDLLDGLGRDPVQQSAADGASGAGGSSPELLLQEPAPMQADAFESQWGGLSCADGNEEVLVPLTDTQVAALMTQIPAPFSGLHQVLQQHKFKVFAEGEQGGQVYTQRASDGQPVLVRYGVEERSGRLVLFAQIRCAEAGLCSSVKGIWESQVSQYVSSEL